MTRFLAGVGLLGLLILLLAALGWGPAPAYGQDRTGTLFRTGMDALNAAHVAHAAADREARDEKLDEAIAAFRAILVDRPEL